MASNEAIHIGGVPIKFPCKPYGTQLSMMAKIIKGIDRRQNCLLESPTGSGKSLALLCSSLGWQSHEHKKQVIAREGSETGGLDDCGDAALCLECPCSNQGKGSTAEALPSDNTTSPGPDMNDTDQPATAEATADEDPDDTADFQPPKMNIRTPCRANQKPHTKATGVVFDDDGEESNMPSTSALTLPTNSCVCSCHRKDDKCKETENEDEEKIRLPKIYFGTRTHKQIAQIIRELKKTAYAGAKMAILGSREHLCVHPEVSRSKNKNDGCRELLDSKNGISCGFYNNVQKMKFHWQLTGLGLPSAWDVEDLVKLGKKVKACSYFASRSLAKDADIVFCPYNYLIDPIIRSAMEISLKGHIVILDEAHNIEDSAREAASVTVMSDELQDTIEELDRLINSHWREEHCRVIHTVVAQLQRWINSHSHSLSQNDFSKASRVWTGVEMVAAFSTMGVTPATFDTLKHHIAALFEEANPQIAVEQMVALTSSSGMLIKGIFIVVDYFFRENMVYMKDYKVALIKEISRRKRQEETNNRWVNARRGSHERFTFSLNFWCMNPAVAFSDVGGEARCIILTSGTLSPMGSFASELGVQFAVSLEANHVIKDSQVWVGSIATGPTGKMLNASYRNTETFNFQDDLGKLVLDVCRTVPYGVLCFMSSYSLMLKLSERWQPISSEAPMTPITGNMMKTMPSLQNTGLWGQLENLKVVMTEARGGQKREFDEQLKEFYHTIQDFEREDSDGVLQNGVLFFAVFRGKVSEGMDFADNNARAVITVGIPFPSFKDPQVELKRAYNDQNRERGLLSGSEWYEIQAYRALNQALGRCLRHKNDWGALILVDERFRRNPQKYISGLSKWVRSKVNHFLHSADGMGSLKNFVVRQQNTSLTNEGSSPTGDKTSLDVTMTPSFRDKSPETPSTSVPVTSSTSVPVTPLSRPTAVMHGFPGLSIIARTPGSQFSVWQQPVTPASVERTPHIPTSSPQVTIATGQENSDSSPQSLSGTERKSRVDGLESGIIPDKQERSSFVPRGLMEFASSADHGTPMQHAQEEKDNVVLSMAASPPRVIPGITHTKDSCSEGVAASTKVTSGTESSRPGCKNSSTSSVPTKSTPNTSNRGKSSRQPGLQSFGFHSTQRNATKLGSVDCTIGQPDRVLGVEPLGLESAMSEPNEKAHIADVSPIGALTTAGAVSRSPDRSTPPPLFIIDESDEETDQDASICREGFDRIKLGLEAPEVNLVGDKCPQDANANVILTEETGEPKDEILENKDGVGVCFVKEVTGVIDDEGGGSTDGLAWISHEQLEQKIIPALDGTPSKQSTPARKATKSKLSRSSKRLREVSNRDGESVAEECEGKNSIIRRSKRRRRRDSHRGEVKAEMEKVTSDAVTQISCCRCDAILCDAGITKVPVGGLQSQYLTGKLAELHTKRTSPRKQHPLKHPDDSSILLRIDPGGSSNVLVKQSRRRGSDDQNAHWSEQDQCCYQPVVCASCGHTSNGTAPVIGHKVVCTGERPIQSGLSKGQLWLLPADIILS